MKQTFHKILSVIMTIVVLFSTMSFTISKHYCGDTLVETALFHKAKGCGMETKATTKSTCEIVKKNCCENEQIVAQGQEELQLQIDKVSFEQQLFIVPFVYSYISLFQPTEKEVIQYNTYSPPLVFKQIFKLDETYLI